MQREAAALATGYEHDDDDDADLGAWTWNDTKWILLQPAAVAVHSLLVACCLLQLQRRAISCRLLAIIKMIIAQIWLSIDDHRRP